MDLNMPVMNGFDATRKIMKLQEKKMIPWKLIIVILSAANEKKNQEESKKLNTYTFLEKPCSTSALKQVFYDYVNNKTDRQVLK